MEPRICSRCWQMRRHGLEFTLRANGDEAVIMAQYFVCQECAMGAYGHWRTFLSIMPAVGKPPWNYRLSVMPWYPEE